MDRVNRVVYVDTQQSQAEVHKLFSTCGQIRALYRWTSEREKTHYFIEFKHVDSVNRARIQRLPFDTHVHSLAYVPQLIDRFCSLAEKGENLEGSGRPSTSSPVRIRRPGPYPTFSSTFKDMSISTRKCASEDKENLGNGVTKPNPTSSKPIPVALGPGCRPALKGEREIVISLLNESITCDLDGLGDDPLGIISLLKLCACERDKWMIIGADYRRRGNSAAAISVMTAMVEVMVRTGVPETDLRPAFLMLSSCQRDLGKRARSPDGADTETAAAHFRESQQWLQKVYGENVPPAETSLLPSSKTTASATIPPKPKTLSLSLPEKPQSVEGVHGRICTLEREIQMLRDRNTAHQDILLESKSLKRKLDDELLCEKAARRKIEVKLDQTESELQLVRRMEGFALEQMKREVESRRKAETREAALIQRIEEMGASGSKRFEEGLFEDLTHMFQKAARVEGRARDVGDVSMGGDD